MMGGGKVGGRGRRAIKLRSPQSAKRDFAPLLHSQNQNTEVILFGVGLKAVKQ